MQYKGVIFDLDGTLLDTLQDLAEAANASLAAFAYPTHPQEKYRYFVGDGLRTLVERILPDDVGTDVVEKVMAKFTEIYAKTWHDNTLPYAGSVEMLKRFNREGVLVAVLSNKPHAFTKVCVEQFFPDCRFHCVYGKREGINKKPDPVGALEIAEKMGLTVDEIAYVGDTATDMQTGSRAGMKTIGVTWGFRKREELVENKAWKIATKPDEVVKYVL